MKIIVNKYLRWFQGGLRGFMGVSRGIKGVIYEFRSYKGICMFLKSILTKQYENNNKKYIRWFPGGLRGFKGVYGVSRGFKGVIYEFRSCIGICMFLKPILTKQY